MSSATANASTGSRAYQFYQLTKPRVVSLIVFTAIIGMLLAVPTASIVRVVVLHMVEKREQAEATHHSPFLHERGPTSAA